MDRGEARPRCAWYVNLLAFLATAAVASGAVYLIDHQPGRDEVALVAGGPTSSQPSSPSTATTVGPLPTSSVSTGVNPSSPMPPTPKAGFRPATPTTVGHSPSPSVPLARLDSLKPVTPLAPSFSDRPPAVQDDGPVLKVQSAGENEITDEEAWLTRNGLERPLTPAADLTGQVPATYRGAQLIGSIAPGGRTFLLYGPNPDVAVFLVAVDLSRGLAERSYDFSAYTTAPEVEPGDEDLVAQGIRWAAQVGDVLYVSHAHNTFARSSLGMNAYITALDVSTGAVRWRSGPLVANAKTFEVVGDVIVSGYGFTAESDFLYVVDRNTGAVLRRQQIDSAPTYIIQKSDQSLYVRCYNRDYVFRLSEKR